MALVTETILSFATAAPMMPAKNPPKALPRSTNNNPVASAVATRSAVASGVCGSNNSVGVGYMRSATILTRKKTPLPTIMPRTTASIFRDVLSRTMTSTFLYLRVVSLAGLIDCAA